MTCVQPGAGPGHLLHMLSLTLHISSHENEKKEDKDKKYLIRERSVKSFERSFTLPEDAEEEKISASYQKGILSVFIPKKPKEEPKKIAVKIN